MTEIYLLIASTAYEGYSIVTAYTDKEKADDQCKRCMDYQETKPRCPEIVKDDKENDKEWERYYKADNKWEKKHPAGKDNCHYDDYYVVAVNLI